MGWFLSAWSAFLDLFFALWPQPYVAKLNMPLRQRLLIGTALGLGIIAFVFSIVKLAMEELVVRVYKTSKGQGSTNCKAPGS